MSDRKHLPSQSKQVVHGCVVGKALRLAFRFVEVALELEAAAGSEIPVLSGVEPAQKNTLDAQGGTDALEDRTRVSRQGKSCSDRLAIIALALLSSTWSGARAPRSVMRARGIRNGGYRAGGGEIESEDVETVLCQRSRIVAVAESDLNGWRGPASFERQGQPAVKPGLRTRGLVQDFLPATAQRLQHRPSLGEVPTQRGHRAPHHVCRCN